MSKKTLITSRDPKGLHAVGLFEAVFNKANLDDRQAQQLNERGGEFQEGILKLICELSNSEQYSDEEVASNYGYPQSFRIRSVTEQVEVLLKHFSDLDANHVEELAIGDLPEGTEGWAVIPKLDKVGKTFHEALETVIGLIAKDRKFKNWREGELTEKNLRLTDKTAKAHTTLNEQPGDFWVLPFQFGIKHRGKSVRRASVVFSESEFGLGVYEVAILLLTHPDRIQPENLNIDCAGVEYDPSASGDFSACLGFDWYYSNEPLKLVYGSSDNTLDQWGSASAFLPQ